jgi:hypothetical protein
MKEFVVDRFLLGIFQGIKAAWRTDTSILKGMMLKWI